MCSLKNDFYALLKEKEDVFDFTQEKAINGCWLWNLENDEIWINPAFHQALGYHSKQIDNSLLNDILYEKDLQHLKKNLIERTSLEKVKTPLEERMIHFVDQGKDAVWFSSDVLCVQHKSISYMLVGFKDISRKGIEKLVQRYESILNNNSTFIIRTDMEGNYTYANKYFCKRFDYSPEEVMGQNSLESIIEEDHLKCYKTVKKCIEHPNKAFAVSLRKPITSEEQKKGRKYIYTDWEYVAITNVNGELSEIQCVGIEVTEKVLGEQKLKYSQHLLQTCNEAVNTGTWRIDLKTKKIEWDEVTKRIHEVEEDYEPNIKEGFRFHFYTQKYKDRSKYLLKEAIEKGKRFDEELKITTAKGNEKWVRAIGIPRYEQDECTELYGTFQDITPQKIIQIQLQAKNKQLEANQKELRQNLEKLKATQRQLLRTQKLLDTSNKMAQIGTWEVNLATSIATWDKITKQIHQEDTDISVNEAINFYKEGYDRERITEVFTQAIEEGVPYDEELKIITAKQNEIWVRVIGIPVEEDGVVKEVYGTFQNIDGQKRAEERLKEKVKELEQIKKELLHTQRLLDATNETAKIGTWQFDLEHYSTKWDKITRQIHEVDEHFVSNAEKGINFYKEGWSRELITKVFNRAVQEGVPFDEELKIITAKQNEIWVRAIGIPTLENGKVVELYGAFQDIDEQKRIEENLKEKVDELEKAQQALQITQDKFTFTLEKTGIGFWELDIQNQTMYWDNQTKKIFGLDENSSISMEEGAARVHPDDAEVTNQRVGTLVSGKVNTLESVYRTVPIDGKVRFLETKALLVKDKNDQPKQVLGITRDITQQKEYEETIEKQNQELAISEQNLKRSVREMYYLQQDLTKQKKQLEQIFDAVPALIYQFRKSPDGRLSFPLLSNGAKSLLGVLSSSIDEEHTQEVIESIYNEDIDKLYQSIDESAESLQTWEQELRLVVDGVPKWIHATSKPTHADDDSIIWTGIAQDINRIKEVEQKVQEKNKQLKATLQELQETQSQLIHNEKMTMLGQLVASIAHEINTPLGAIKSSASSIEQMLGDVLSTLPKNLRALSEEELEQFDMLLEKAIQADNLYSVREKRTIKYDLIDAFKAKKIPKAEKIADLITDMGIHKEKELYEKFLQMPKGAKILETVYEVSTIARSNKTIKVATEKASKIILTLKNFSRQDHTGEKVPTDINQNLEDTLILYHNKVKYGIEIVRSLEHLPIIHTYEDELAQVWTNLLHNAIQAILSESERGKIFLTTKNQSNSILVSIRDTGKGIPEEVQPRIFDAFFSTKSAGEGSGLGLSIVRKIIDKHGGKIWFETQNEGKDTGTTFFVELPVSR